MKALVLRSLLSVAIGIATTVAVSAQTASSPIGNAGNLLNYPPGIRIYQGGAIATPSGTIILPNVTMPGANGSNTYYYPDGSHVTTNSRTVSPAGTFLTPNSPNGGLSNPTTRPNGGLSNPTTRPIQSFPRPGSLNRGVNQR